MNSTDPIVCWALIAAALIGHGGLNIAIYNRVNGFGMPRKLIKAIELVFLVFTISLPLAVWFLRHDLVIDLLRGRPDQVSVGPVLASYGLLCLAAWIFLGIPWLMWRPIWGLEWVRARRDVDVVDVAAAVSRPLALTAKCRLESRLPMNQIFELSIDKIELPVVGLPQELDGFRIAHLSDIHLTGEISAEYTQYVVQRATEAATDLMAITGDIIDSRHCVDWLPKIFSTAEARHGCFFVLGNHDRRIDDSRITREAMKASGWIDLGGRVVRQELDGVPGLLIGNEYPWYPRPNPEVLQERPRQDRFRLLLSHSPDQLSWARRHDVTLMLAGHTHGGQGRLPLAGPILSPSFHGSRFASGDFYKAPTTLHVSRGLSGTHLIRIRCRPELSILTLRRSSVDDERT